MSIVTVGRRRISFRIEARQAIHTGDVLQEAMYPLAEMGHPIVREEIKIWYAKLRQFGTEH
jgi:hypothetical protein